MIKLEIDRNSETSLKRYVFSAFKRNSLLMLIISLVLFTFIYFAIYVIMIIKFLNPRLMEDFANSILSTYSDSVPEPETQEFFLYIFTNNTGCYWNPIKLLVWIPLLGASILGLSFLLNGVIVGIVATILGLEHGPLLPIAGLLPHGIIEIPAFIIQWAAISRWQITTVTLIFNLVRGEKIDKTKVKKDLMDILILSITSIFLLFIAALIETYITPSLIRLVSKNIKMGDLGGGQSLLRSC